jgi:hypothetical protein
VAQKPIQSPKQAWRWPCWVGLQRWSIVKMMERDGERRADENTGLWAHGGTEVPLLGKGA